MAQVAMHPPQPLERPEVGVHEPAGDIPQGWFSLEAWTHWIKTLFASIGALLLPIVLEEERVTIVPTLAKNATYDVFKSFVNNELDSQQDLSERNIAALTDDNPQGLKEELLRMGCILKMVTEAGDWIKDHKAEFGNKGIEATQINETLLRSQRLVGQLLQRLPKTGDLLQPAPLNWMPKAQVSPGAHNHGSDCFMNSALQGVFGDPFACRWLALNEHQHPCIKRLAFQYQEACRRGQTAPIDMAQELRRLFPEINNGEQHEVHRAFIYLISSMSGDDRALDPEDPHIKDRREYEAGNPFVHKITRRATYAGVDMSQVKESDLGNFQENVHVTSEFHWCPILPLEGGMESSAMESLLDNFFRPSEDNIHHFNFHKKDGTSQETTATEEVNQFTKCPKQLFLSFKRTNWDPQKKTYFRSSRHIELDETFYLDPKHVQTGEGGEYEISYFACHGGAVNSLSGASGGHYWCYRKVDGEWYYYSDTTRRKASIAEVKKDLQGSCELLLASRVDDKPMTAEEVSIKVQENIEKAKAAQLEREIASAKAPLPTGDTLDVKENHLRRVSIFNDLLNKDGLPQAQLLEVFTKTPPEFQAFCKEMLIIEGKMEATGDVQAHLLDLKTIMKQHLTTELNEHIVAQYLYIRQKQLEMIREEMRAAQLQVAMLSHTKHLQAASILFQNSMTLATFRLNALTTLLARLDDTDEQSVRDMGEILIPGLHNHIEARMQVEAGAEPPPILRVILEDFRASNEALIQNLQQQLALNEQLSKS